MELKQGQRDALSEFVKTLQIANGKPTVENYDSLLALEKKILIASPWKEMIGPREFSSILWDATWSGALGLETADVRLDDPQHSELFDRVFNNIRHAFELLPLSYQILVPFTGFPELGAAVVPIVPGLALVDASFDDELAARLNDVHPKVRNPLLHIAAGGLRGFPMMNEVVKTRYLRIDGRGYAGRAADPPVVRAALATAKQFIALAVQERAAYVEPQWKRRWDDKASEDRSAALLFPTDGGRGARIEVPTELMSFFHRVMLDTSKLTVREPGQSLLGGTERAPITPDEMSQAVLSSLERTRRFLALDGELEDAKRIRSSMEWAIDAATTSNESIAFLQRCIAFEALLGSDEKNQQRSVTDRLSDRYAYLLGQTESQRKQERTRFRRMYDHRSDIVHGRAGHLSEEHRRAAVEAERMLAAVLFKETGNLLLSRLRG
ncbi:HEPN domain-containing protein [Cupriavidus taiwanensis]|uniref:Uncharacterized protein n=1 Tax=Cupriavidus taiwanensis TaxID=164546 RepID=A0A375JD74_9BURK|nr:HEPN domain-containing protein [Cupriavidus taiwanensis]SPS03067.1 hypothetical protein CBM2634_U70029 [Cupriavidus taiwanensis]